MLMGLQTTLTSVQPYTGYLLCLRMLNSSGATDWVVPRDNAEHQTAPAMAPRPSKDNSRSEDDRDMDSETIVWEVQTRGTATVPRLQTAYNIFTITHAVRNDSDTTDTDNSTTTTRVARPKATECAAG